MKKYLTRILIVIFLCNIFFILGAIMQKETDNNPITRDVIINAEKLIGIKFSDAKRDSMRTDLNELEKSYESIRKVPLSNDIPPAILFNPIP